MQARRNTESKQVSSGLLGLFAYVCVTRMSETCGKGKKGVFKGETKRKK